MSRDTKSLHNSICNRHERCRCSMTEMDNIKWQYCYHTVHSMNKTTTMTTLISPTLTYKQLWGSSESCEVEMCRWDRWSFPRLTSAPTSAAGPTSASMAAATSSDCQRTLGRHQCWWHHPLAPATSPTRSNTSFQGQPHHFKVNNITYKVSNTSTTRSAILSTRSTTSL